MAQLNNFFNNANIKCIAQDENKMFQIIEHQADLSLTPSEAAQAYFCTEMNVKRRQVIVNLNGSNSVILSSGAMQWMLGNIEAKTDIKGAGDLLGKMVTGKATGESAIKPVYQGVGRISLEPTYKHLLLEDISKWNGGIVMDDGMFLACDGRLQQKMYRKSISGGLAERGNFFNMSLVGQEGTVVLESPVAREEIIEVMLENETLTVDGDLVIAWSPSVQMVCRPMIRRSLIGSGATGEGLVNVFTGTGRVLLAPTL